MLSDCATNYLGDRSIVLDVFVIPLSELLTMDLEAMTPFKGDKLGIKKRLSIHLLLQRLAISSSRTVLQSFSLPLLSENKCLLACHKLYARHIAHLTLTQIIDIEESTILGLFHVPH